ncbi:MAG: class II fructose-bisphosphate aldolase, partial [Clostridia bacterium]|nr:class II fructose-bisphosphate aldolase [Clostridia bacterium]
MALVNTKEMFKKAYESGYAIGAFNINNMEIIQAITEAAGELKSPVVLQVSAGARKYAKHSYLMALANAAVEDS